MNFAKTILAATAISAGSAASALPVQFAGNGHWYEVVETQETHFGAFLGAMSLGGYLVTITDAAEQAFIESTFGNAARYWTGGNDMAVEGDFEWIDGPEAGTPFTYTNWRNGAPQSNYAGQDHVFLEDGTGEWVDVNGNNGNHVYAYLVEYTSYIPPVPVPAGLPLAAGALGLLAFAKRRKNKKA